MIPGEVLLEDGPVWINPGMPTITLTVVNVGDRPVQVGSHYYLAEANPALRLDREAAWGHRLDILAGSAVRFEPGMTVEVTLVPIGGARVVRGLRGACGGRLDV